MLTKVIHGSATNQVAGLMSAEDKQLLTTISNNYVSTSALGSLMGANSGVATLDASGKIPSSQLPSYVDDVIEAAQISAFPATGESGKIYVALDTNKTYRWSGSAYVEISESLALGETSSTAYRGDRGKSAYDHATAKGSAFASGLYKITTNSEGHVTAATAVVKADITGLGIPAQDTTYQSLAAVSEGTDVSLVTTGEKYKWEHSYLPLSGGTMTGQIILARTGYKTHNEAGYSVDNYGNFKHLRTTTSDYHGWAKNNATVIAKLYWETGNFEITGSMTATSFIGSLTGNADTATADADGNTISSTYLKLSGGTVTGNIHRYYSAASSEPMISIGSYNQDVYLWQIGHSTTGPITDNSYGLRYKGTGTNPNNYLQLLTAVHGSSPILAVQMDEAGKIVIYKDITFSGGLKTNGTDIALGTNSSSSNDSGDLVWLYGNGTEKMRIYAPTSPTGKTGPLFRMFNASGQSLYSGNLPLADGTSATGTWNISITGTAAKATADANGNTISSSYLKLSGGTMTGGILPVGKDSFIAYPSDGCFTTETGSITGYIKIKLPQIKSQTMISFDVDIYNYVDDTSIRYHIAGYPYTDYNWYSSTAYAIGPVTNEYANLTVRFVCDGSADNYITIGETTTVWKYPQIAVHNIVMGFKNMTYSKWASGWTVSIISTAITGAHIKATKTNTNIAYRAKTDADGNTISSTYLKLSGGTVTGATTIKSILTLYRESSTTDNFAAGILFSTKDTTVNKAYTNAYIYAYHDHSSTNGANMVIHPGGNLFVGSGESAANLYPTYKASTGENLFITSDETAYMYANAQTIANRIGFAVTTAGAIVPQKAEAANNNVQDIGASNNKWANVYATTFNGALSGNASTATKFASGGTTAQFYRGDQTWTNVLLGPLKIGTTDTMTNSGYATDNIGMNNYIAFYGVYGDAVGSYTHTFIGERIYGSKTTANEQSELLLFHGNDIVGTSGPDRVRVFSGAFRVDTYTTATSGAWPTIGESANAIQAFNIDGTNGIVLGNTTARSNGVNQTTINGHLVINGSYNSNNSYNEGLRINKSSNNWAVIQLGGAAGSTTGTAEGQYLIGVNGDGYAFWAHNGSNGAASRIQGHKANGWSVRPRLYVNADCGTDYNVSVNGSTNSTTYTVNAKVRLEYNSTDQSLDFVFV